MKYLLLLLVPFMAQAQTKFSNESEVSIVQTGGNSGVETYNGKTLSKWERTKRVYSFGGHYMLGMTENRIEGTNDKEKVESARNWDVLTKYEQTLSEKLHGIASVQFEGNEFSGLKQRENYDLGGKYIIAKDDVIDTFAEVGARYTVERRIARDEDNEDTYDFTKARLYYEIGVKYSTTLSYKFWVEYIPNFTDAVDYLVTYEPSMAVVLTETFSLKTSYKAIYDNKPNVEGYENTDYTFSTSLIAKF
jgi:putative salt-induced outer membrane protein